MTKRERFLASLVAIVVALFIVQYVVNSILGGLREKEASIDAARARSADMDKVITDGKIAARALEELVRRSLPRDEQQLTAQYRDWLTELSRSVGLEEIEIRVPERPIQTTEAFAAYQFSLTGRCRLDRMLELLGRFYDQNYLHRIARASIDQWIDSRNVRLSLDSVVLALNDAAPDQPKPTGSSGRLEKPIEDYIQTILNRNPFSPPNNPPRIRIASRVTIERGRRWELPFSSAAEDPDGLPVRIELVSTDIPPGLKVRRDALEWTPETPGKHEIVIRAADEGWPPKSVEHRLVLEVVDPPKPSEPPPKKPEFDPASQTYVSAILGGRYGEEVWIRSRLEGKLLKLRVGDEFEVGSIRATVVAINLRENFVELESDGRRWIVDMDTPLSKAFEQAQVD